MHQELVGAAALDQRARFTRLNLHAATRPRSPAAGHLHRLADAPQHRRHSGRRPICAALIVYFDRLVLAVHGLWEVTWVAGVFYGIKPRRNGHCGAGRPPYRRPRPHQQATVGP